MLPKQSDIQIPLLKCLDEIGGKAKPPEIYPRLLKCFPGITPKDLTQTPASGANKWKNCVAWVRQRLISDGEMESLARGVWAITDKGRKRLASPEHSNALAKKRGRRPARPRLDCIERLFPTVSSSVKTEARSRRLPMETQEDEFENAVWNLVFNLVPSAITTGRDPEIVLPGGVFRPDLVALFGDSRILIAECKLTKSDAYIAAWVSQLRNSKRSIEETLKACGCQDFVYVLAVEDKTALAEHLRREVENLRIKLIDRRQVEYFQEIRRACGIGVGHMFWALVAPWAIHHKDEKLPALRIKQGKNREVYVFPVNAHDLLSRSFVSHRQLHSPEEGIKGFQRMLQKKKLREIAEYIKRFKTFPTPIVVAFRKAGTPVFEPLPRRQRASEEMAKEVEFGLLRLPKDVNSIQVIDGQHRLYGYSGLSRSDDHVIHVVGYKAIKDPSPASLFVDINSKQTKVPGRLLWELYPEIYSDEDPEYFKAEISRVTEAVAKRHLSGFVQHISSGMKGEISFHTLCTEIRRARLIRPAGFLQSEDELKIVLEAFFIALKQLGDQHPGVNESFVFSNNGITPMIRTMGRIVQYEIGHNRRDNLKRKNLLAETFRSFFEPVYQHFVRSGDEALRRLRKERIGNAGSITTEDEITEKIRSRYKPDFPYRPKKTPPEWDTAIGRFATTVATINREGIDKGATKGWVFREFDPEKFKKELGKPIDNYDSFGTVLKLLYQEVIEGSGKDGPENRLKSLLKVESIYDLEPIAKLNILRTYWEHKAEQVDAKKRQLAVHALSQLSKRPDLSGPSELDRKDYQNMAISLVESLTVQVLEPTLGALRQ